MKQPDRKKSEWDSSTKFVPSAERKYIAFYKPYGVLSQFSPEPGSDKRTLAEFSFPKDVYPIGRLDYDSEGLLLLSDDGRLNSRLLEPTRGHRRTYLAQVERVPDANALLQLERGVIIEGQKTLPAEAKLLDEDPGLAEREVPIRFRKTVPTRWIRLTLKEGKNRQVRRMTAAVGHPTLRLVRVAIGLLELKELGLTPGEWMTLSSTALQLCFQ